MYSEYVLVIAVAIAAATPTGFVKILLAKICGDSDGEKIFQSR
jgi:hypothetical protein